MSAPGSRITVVRSVSAASTEARSATSRTTGTELLTGKLPCTASILVRCIAQEARR
jgi:hypothetical protein